MAIPEKKVYTPEEYLALEEQSEERHEYYRGQIYAMSGASDSHNQIAGNMYMSLRQQLRAKPCRVYINDMRLLIKKSGLYTYPDVMAVCGKVEFIPGRTDTVTNPILVVEVLSDSTKDYDRTTKFTFYRQLASFREYMLIDQKRAYVEVFRRTESGLWMYEAYDELSAQIKLTSLDIEIPISTIYEQVEFPDAESGYGTAAIDEP